MANIKQLLHPSIIVEQEEQHPLCSCVEEASPRDRRRRMAVDVTSLYQKCLTRKNEIDNELDTIEPGQRIPVAKRQRLQGLEKEFGTLSMRACSMQC